MGPGHLGGLLRVPGTPSTRLCRTRSRVLRVCAFSVCASRPGLECRPTSARRRDARVGRRARAATPAHSTALVWPAHAALSGRGTKAHRRAHAIRRRGAHACAPHAHRWAHHIAARARSVAWKDTPPPAQGRWGGWCGLPATLLGAPIFPARRSPKCASPSASNAACHGASSHCDTSTCLVFTSWHRFGRVSFDVVTCFVATGDAATSIPPCGK